MPTKLTPTLSFFAGGFRWDCDFARGHGIRTHHPDGPIDPATRIILDAIRATPGGIPNGHLYIRTPYGQSGDLDGYHAWLGEMRHWIEVERDLVTVRSQTPDAYFAGILATPAIDELDRKPLLEVIRFCEDRAKTIKLPSTKVNYGVARRAAEQDRWNARAIHLHGPWLHGPYVKAALAHIGKGPIRYRHAGPKDPVLFVGADRAAVVMPCEAPR